MTVAIRLMRFGKRADPKYRVVAIDKRRKRNGAYLEKIGTYNPMKQDSLVEMDWAKYEAWQKKGAQVSEGLKRLLRRSKTKKD